ncbi:uncharacterized protein LOC727116 [Apis mellifera]|uniref:Uncharacterized protein LOC727116 n=1 Tax=Apis mellifera TaxID=7460 RepID=A0A7M7G0H4_APIME|nr:uncharacterized protein LOC727116 [Apis mellifera]|eukprot:XP_001122830.2 uncharacterized protein LOC727116 [Apis mellifera]
MIRFVWIWKIIFRCVMFILCIQSEIFNIVNSVKVSFSCLNRTAGFYADTDAGCKIYYTCDEYGNKFTYHCPEETAFRQDALICDHAHLVHCEKPISSTLKEYNEKPEETKDDDSSYSKDKSRSLFPSFPMTRLMKTNNEVGYKFIPNSDRLFKNLDKTIENKAIDSFYPSNYNNVTTNFETNAGTRYMIDEYDKNGLKKNESFSIRIQSFYDKDKRNEKSTLNQRNYSQQKMNDAVYNLLKVSSYTLSHARENNAKGYQPDKNTDNFLKLSSINYRNYPYLETLKSIQRNTKILPTTTGTATMANIPLATTELPVYALTLSLKPLIPNELEYDPYYPGYSTTTETYYTPVQNVKEWSRIGNSTRTMWSNIHFRLPSVLPDLNSLDDIVDRRKLLYIPRIKFD